MFVPSQGTFHLRQPLFHPACDTVLYPQGRCTHSTMCRGGSGFLELQGGAWLQVLGPCLGTSVASQAAPSGLEACIQGLSSLMPFRRHSPPCSVEL